MTKVCLVTGGAKGIGAKIVEVMAQNYNVVFTYNESEIMAKQLVEKLKKAGKNVIAIKADIRVEKDVKRFIDFALEKFNHIDVIVNNAGICAYNYLDEVSVEEWNNIFEVNMLGAYLVCRFALKNMIANKSGNIINIASMWGQVGASMEVHYSSSKAALIGFTKALSKEVGPSNIRINCVCPGAIQTDMLKLDDNIKQSIINDTPLGRIGNTEDIANAVEFLASDRASFITGQIIGVNGGYVV